MTYNRNWESVEAFGNRGLGVANPSERARGGLGTILLAAQDDTGAADRVQLFAKTGGLAARLSRQANAEEEAAAAIAQV